MKEIFETVKLGKLTVKNRLVRSATWEALAGPDGSLTPEIYQLYEELAQGGVGTIITGFTTVSAGDVYIPGMMRLTDDKLISQYQKLTNLVHNYKTAIIAQLALGAFTVKADGSWYDGTPTQERLYEKAIDDLDDKDMAKIIDDFSQAARRAQEAGFDGVQLHLAHHFFLSRFLAPIYNHRQGKYDSSLAGRLAFVTDIYQAVRQTAPKLHIMIKINSSDFTPDGLTPAESLQICEALAQAGIESIEVSGNGTSVAGIRPGVNEGYFSEFATRLAKLVDIPVILVGGLRSRAYMDQVLNETKIEFLSLSRPLVREPDFPKKLEAEEVSAPACVSCNACYRTPGHRCIVTAQ